MDRLPSYIMFDIFSRIPPIGLARSRCVSKVWCEFIDDRYLTIVHDKQFIEEPTPILYHARLSHGENLRSLCFHVIESKQTKTGTPLTYVLEPKEYPCLEFLSKKTLSKSSIVDIEFRGSCNGLMCLLLYKDDGIETTLVVVHPLRKECYEVPPLPEPYHSSMFQKSCGLGFDASTNTLKMVCVFPKHCELPSEDHEMVRKINLCTMVHEIGTNSWREIPQVPPYCIMEGAVFANGCLHWLGTGSGIRNEDGGRPVVWFDVIKEEFGLMACPPKRIYDRWKSNYIYGWDYLVDLNGAVGYVCVERMGVWVLKQKEWMAYCRIKREIVPCGEIDVLGCWNRDGDILIRTRTLGSRYEFFIYNLKSDVPHKTNIVVPDNGRHPHIFMHPNKVFSIHGIGTNSFPMKKIDLKNSCQLLLSCIEELEI